MDKIYMLDMPIQLTKFLSKYKNGKIRKEDLSDYLTEVFKIAYKSINDIDYDIKNNAKIYHALIREVIHFISSLNNSNDMFFGDFIKTTIEIIPEFSDLIGYNNLSIDYKVIVVSPSLLRIERSK